MAKLEKIWINSEATPKELRIDWDNDRHQLVQLKSLEAKDIELALFEAIQILRAEQSRGEI